MILNGRIEETPLLLSDDLVPWNQSGLLLLHSAGAVPLFPPSLLLERPGNYVDCVC